MKKTNKEILLVVVLFATLVIIKQVLAPTFNQGAQYSIFNTTKTGTSVIYDVYKNMGLDISPYYMEINKQTTTNYLQIVLEPNNEILTTSKRTNMIDFVYGGGNLVYSTSYYSSKFLDYFENAQIISSDEFGTIYKYGVGHIYLAKTENVINSTSIENSGQALSILDFAANWNNSRIYFNEYYHGYSNGEKVIAYIPKWMKYSYYQLIVITILLVILKGKRFGKALIFYELEEREENEYIKTLASIYFSSKKWEVIINNFYSNFIKLSCKHFSYSYDYLKVNIITIWKENGLKNLSELEQVVDLIEKTKTENSNFKLSKKDLHKYINNICQLEKIVGKK